MWFWLVLQNAFKQSAAVTVGEMWFTCTVSTKSKRKLKMLRRTYSSEWNVDEYQLYSSLKPFFSTKEYNTVALKNFKNRERSINTLVRVFLYITCSQIPSTRISVSVKVDHLVFFVFIRRSLNELHISKL